MTMRSTGGATLANQIVQCEWGIPKRTLGGIVGYLRPLAGTQYGDLG